MEIQIERDAFLRTLSRIQSVVERRNTMPILGCALLTAEEGELTVSATDLEVSLRTRCAAEVVRAGALAVGARKLHDIVRELPSNEQIRLRASEENRLTLTCGNSRFVLTGQSADQFPEIPKATTDLSLPMESADLSNMLGKTHFAMSQDETRYTLNGIFLQLDPAGSPAIHPHCTGDEKLPARIRLVATDTHRLAVVERDLAPEVSGQLTEPNECILPKKAVFEIRKLLDEEKVTISLTLGAGYLQIRKTDLDLITKLVEGRFPDYRRVIPELKDPQMVNMERAALYQVVKRMSVLSHEKSRGIRLALRKDAMRITTDNPEQEAGEDEMAVLYDGNECSIGFNARYLLDITSAMDCDDLRMTFLNEDTPVLITDPEKDTYFYILMPMRV